MWRRPEHLRIVSLLRGMNAPWLLENRCWFGGGTAVVLTHGEYRVSRDVDFLCDDVLGYRELRSMAIREGAKGFFRGNVEQVRDVRVDQYGVRMCVALDGIPIKVEIIREARISLSGSLNSLLGVPVLSTTHLMAEKLLANADRGEDPSIAHRDAVDLGFLVLGAGGDLSPEACEMALRAYGEDVLKKLFLALEHLGRQEERRRSAMTLGMELDDVDRAIMALRRAVYRRWPPVPGLEAEQAPGSGDCAPG